MKMKRIATYIVATTVIIAASLLVACGGPQVQTTEQATASQQAAARAAAQDYLDTMQVACRDGKEYLVGTGFRDNVVAPTGELCIR